MASDPIRSDPDRLVDEDSEAGRAARTMLRAQSARGDQPAAWKALEKRLAQRRSAWRIAANYSALGAAAGLALVVAGSALGLWHVPGHGQKSPVSIASAEPRITPTDAPVGLGPGHSVLADGTTLDLSSEGRAQLRGAPARWTRVSLRSGAIELAVTPRSAGAEFEVDAEGYQFRVVGTRFVVMLERTLVRLEVKEGAVAVHDARARLAVVPAGGQWERSLLSEPAREQQPSPLLASSAQGKLEAAPDISARGMTEDASECLRLAREDQPGSAAACYQRVAQGSGLSAEMALLELARLRRNVFHDPSAALAALKEYNARYPRGIFRTEAAINTIELLTQSGRSQQALAEADRVLATGVARERHTEVRLLRAKILDERLGDCRRAETEYANVALERNALGAQAELRRAKCLEALGRIDAAIAIYRAYLRRGSPLEADQARARLKALTGSEQ